jgi:hypothetical protein
LAQAQRGDGLLMNARVVSEQGCTEVASFLAIVNKQRRHWTTSD